MTDRLGHIEALLDQIDNLAINLKISEAEKLVERKDKILSEM